MAKIHVFTIILTENFEKIGLIWVITVAIELQLNKELLI